MIIIHIFTKGMQTHLYVYSPVYIFQTSCWIGKARFYYNSKVNCMYTIVDGTKNQNDDEFQCVLAPIHYFEKLEVECSHYFKGVILLD
jgi:hypothetical protein